MTQEEALKILTGGHNIYLTGAAGSGKTYLLNRFIRHLRAKGIPTGITASTGIAATHMEGITIHSWAGIGLLRNATDKQVQAITDNKRLLKRLLKTRTLIIDEVSMLDAARLDLVDRVTRMARGKAAPFGGLKVVLCGDFFQLPPVSIAGEPAPGFVFNSAVWNNMELKVCYLHEQFRQGDMEFLRILNAIRNAAVDETAVNRLRQSRSTVFSSSPLSRIVKLYAHNQDVDLENRTELARLKEKEHEYLMDASGIPAIADSLKRGCLAPEKLVLKRGAAVMFVKNNFEKGYVNGTLGTVGGFDDSGFPVITLLNGNEIIARPATWSVEENGKVVAQATQVPLRLAWAITVHKSQGMTLDAAQVDLSRCFEKGMGYVALSRVRSLKGLRLLGFNDLALKVNEETLAFDQTLHQLSEAALHTSISLPGNELQPDKPLKTTTLEEIREKYPSAYQKWTPAEEKKLVEAFTSGQSIDSLAGMMGREAGGIRSRLKRLGLIDRDNITITPAGKRAQLKRRRAEEILEQLQLVRRWEQYGRPVKVGALALDLMVDPDIDLEIYCPQLKIEQGFQVLSECAMHPQTQKASFINRLNTPDRALYWQIIYRDDDGTEWKIDMWSARDDYALPRDEHLIAPLLSRLTPETREAILLLKESRSRDNTLKCPSIDLYRAVLDDGVRTVEEMRTWLASHETGKLTDWEPL